MLSVLMALTLTAPVGADVAGLSPCAPNKHTACHRPAQPAGKYEVPLGKRCHPDPTKSFGCIERIGSAADRQREKMAAR